MKRSKQLVTKVLCMTAMIVLMIGCSQGNKADEISEVLLEPPVLSNSKAFSLARFNNCEDVAAKIKETLKIEVLQTVYDMQKNCRHTGDNYFYSESPSVSGSENSREQLATGTNLQEKGIDEADLIKVEGDYAYAIVENRVWIAKIRPFVDLKNVAYIPQSGLTGLYLDNGTLIALEEQAGTAAVEHVYNVKDPLSPVKIKSVTYSGTLMDSRRIGSKLHMVVGNQARIPQLDYSLEDDVLPDCPEEGESKPTRKLVEALIEIRDENLKIVDALTAKDALPFAFNNGPISCSETFAGDASAGYNFISVISDEFLSTDAKPQNATILGGGGTVYTSRSALYVATQAIPFLWGWLTESESFEDSTIIHRFSLDGSTPVYTGSGKVAGHLMDDQFVGSRMSANFSMSQFAMSEHNGYLRIATTTGNTWFSPEKLENQVSVLNVSSPSLEKAGEVKGFGKGEKIHAVRFMGDTAYVVTFKKTDPLYVIDVKEPRAPKIAGELKVPGFSTYLHPLNDGNLIGLGYNATEDNGFAWTQGLKISTFDVANPAAPSEIDNLGIGSRGSYSVAVEEHHAFTYDSARQLVSIPVEIFEGGNGTYVTGQFSYSGVELFKVAVDGSLGEAGTIKFVEAQQGFAPTCGVNGPTRTVILTDNDSGGVLTLVPSGLILNRIDEKMSEVGRLGAQNLSRRCPISVE